MEISKAESKALKKQAKRKRKEQEADEQIPQPTSKQLKKSKRKTSLSPAPAAEKKIKQKKKKKSAQDVISGPVASSNDIPHTADDIPVTPLQNDASPSLMNETAIGGGSTSNDSGQWNDWDSMSKSLGSKKDKFLKLMGGTKKKDHGSTAPTSQPTHSLVAASLQAKQSSGLEQEFEKARAFSMNVRNGRRFGLGQSLDK